MGTGRPEEEAAQGPPPPDRVAVRHTFLKQERIRCRKDFLAVYHKGKRSARDGLAMHALATGHKWTRLGISVGRKFGRAVRRNLVKRRLRKIFRLCKHQLKLGRDVVITVRREAADRSHAELQEAVTALLAELDLFRSNTDPAR